MSRILVIDDEPSMRITLQAFLEKDGYQVSVANDAISAYEMINFNHYDVVLTDIIMPGMTGIELLTKIRQHSDSVQVIVMTGEPTVGTAVNAVKHGANDYLSKPIDRETLLKTVKQAAQIKFLHDENESLEKERIRYLSELENIVSLRTKELQTSMQSIVLLCSTVIELRDPYTAGHQRRVGNLSAAIAKRLGLSESIVTNVRITGYLHDIGKLVVPTEILTKPGRLNSFEMGLIRTHSEQGFDMLELVKLPGNVAEIVYQHHERLDGCGYPRGLKDHEILDEACILAVADVVEAMMSHRPYRPALGIDLALEEITSNIGILYRPNVVEACVKLFEEDDYALDDHEHEIIFQILKTGETSVPVI